MVERGFGRSDEEEEEGGGVARCERLLQLLGSGEERSRNKTIFAWAIRTP